MENKDAFKFTGEDAVNYDKYLGPLLFEPYGRYMASQIETTGLQSVLEIASGTGRVTRHIRKALSANVSLTATDISADMLNVAKRALDNEGITFAVEDAQQLSFADNTFDLVICQFGMMFLPDQPKGFAEILRVLKPGGKFMFFTWEDTLKLPLFKLLINDLILPHFKDEDTGRFFVPFSLHDPVKLKDFMVSAGFKQVHVDRVVLQSGAPGVEHIVDGLFLKHRLGREVTVKDPSAVEPIAKKFAKEIEKQFGAEQPKFSFAAYLTTGKK
jgi:SAM-dependent methyltransferase